MLMGYIHVLGVATVSTELMEEYRVSSTRGAGDGMAFGICACSLFKPRFAGCCRSVRAYASLKVNDRSMGNAD